MQDEMPTEIRSLVAQCEAGVSSFNNDQMSAALCFAENQHLRLLRFEAACEAIWPAIRPFGLCGADPVFIAAMAEIGELLGKSQPSVDSAGIILSAKLEAREQIADIVADDPAFKGKIGRGLAAEFAGLIRNLQLSSE